MLTAKEALKMSERAANDIVPLLMEEGLTWIKSCAENGHRRCSWIMGDKPEFIIEELIKEVKKLGYKAKLKPYLYVADKAIGISW